MLSVREIVVRWDERFLFVKGDHEDIARKIEKMLIDQKLRQSAGEASCEVIKKGLSNRDIEGLLLSCLRL